MPKLAVAHGWSPLGETAYTVINKIQNLNALGPSNLKELFLIGKNHHFNRLESGLFNRASIVSATGWSKNSLKYSFEDSFPILSGTLSRNVKTNDYTNGWFKKFRNCPVCYSHGTHLIFHQSALWEKCPIHFCELQTVCSNCGIDNSKFQATYQSTGFSCENCGFSGFENTRKYTSKYEHVKKRLVDEYGNWITEVNQRALGWKAPYIWTTMPPSNDCMALYLRLFGGPSWMKRSIAGYSTTKLKKYKVENTLSPIRPRKSIHATNFTHGGSSHYKDIDHQEYRRIFQSKMQSLEWRCKREILKLNDQTHESISDYLVSSIKCLSQLNQKRYHMCKLKNAYLKWFANHQEFTAHGSGGLSFFWCNWLDGPGRDFRISASKNNSIAINNYAYTFAVSELWMRAVHLADFQSYLPLTESLPHLASEPPVFTLYKGDELVLYEASANEPLADSVMSSCPKMTNRPKLLRSDYLSRT